MRLLLLTLLLPLLLPAASPTDAPAAKLWADLQSKREALPSLHQEFEVTRTFKTAQNTQSSTWTVTLDIAPHQWRELSTAGDGSHSRIFDGTDLFFFEPGGVEYVRPKHPSKDDQQVPMPYAFAPNWPKAIEHERRPCGLSNVDHQCVVLDFPLKAWVKGSPPKEERMRDGSMRVILDLQTGLLISSFSIQNIEATNEAYRREEIYILKRMSYGGAADPALFRLPSANMKEVKELSHWNAAAIKKQLAGKTAPDLVLKDLHGQSITLSALKGKTVLLDFWATWCGPCRADGPALEKLYRKYSDRDLVIIGISVDEDRPAVEKFLAEHPHTYPIVLTSENDMPKPYQVGLFPTYIIIDKDGALATATEGEQGFGDLRSLLHKAGLDSN
jgi:thiol-disulfide isomerase/thioredoxin